MITPKECAASLSFWSEPVEPKLLTGGMTNTNFLVEHQGAKFFVRVGVDIEYHGVMRFNELAASKAAYLCGLSPPVLFSKPGVLVLPFLEARTLGPEDLRDEAILRKVLPLLKRCHDEMPRRLRGPILAFSVFYVNRDYLARLSEEKSRSFSKLPRLSEINDDLERTAGRTLQGFGHNDLLPANLMDDGQRLWLIDWDYAGVSHPLFDLSNLASNSQMAPEQEKWLLAEYFQEAVTTELWRRYNAMKCASLLREAMWSMVSEIHSTLTFDFARYTEANLLRFEEAFEAYRRLG